MDSYFRAFDIETGREGMTGLDEVIVRRPLLGHPHDVHVAADAVASRTPQNREIGLHKMERAGATITSVETALFELLERAGSDEFKAIQELVK